jgi:dihydrofolate reductase
MRTVTYGAACSFDGFITGPNGAIDWLHNSRDANEIMREYWKTIDTLVMGRKTWEIAASYGGGGSGGMQSYVFSRTLDRIKKKGVTLVKDDPGTFVRDLKQRDGKGICVFGGSDFARALFAADVVDEVGANVHPVLLGSGTPLFVDPQRRTSLELKECRPIDGGCVYMIYRVVH